MSDRRSVQIRAEIYEQIVPTVKAATGIVPNVTEFVTSAVAEKLEQYKLAGSTASSQKGKKAS